jgi:hypothetical protein
MAYKEAKVYFDGSHYIAIPKTTRPTARKRGGIKDEKTNEKKNLFFVNLIGQEEV